MGACAGDCCCASAMHAPILCLRVPGGDRHRGGERGLPVAEVKTCLNVSRLRARPACIAGVLI